MEMATRTQLGPEDWKRHLTHWLESGQTQAQYCSHAGLNTKTFNRWKTRLTAGVARKAPTTEGVNKPVSLVPVRVAQQEPPDVSHLRGQDIRIRLDGRQWVVDVPTAVDPKNLAMVLGAIASIAQ